MLTKLYIVALTLLGLSSYNISRASHIVGGDLTYELISRIKSEYKIKLTIYFDCKEGNERIIAQDSFAIIGVYGAKTKYYLGRYRIKRTGPDTIRKASYSCVKVPLNACVVKYEYTTTQIIDPGADGKILAYQRCCRNSTIINVTNPSQTGATIWVTLPPMDNSSAVFKSLPPNFVCVGVPLTIDHSATDLDGDFLEYFLGSPYWDENSNRSGYAPSRPPYSPVLWVNGYSGASQLGGSSKLSIDRITGELSALPTRVGQYVVGIGVREYRDGVLINETLRDYQINVIPCYFDLLAYFTTEGYLSSTDAYVFECSDTVFFKDRSIRAETYEWDFGDPSTTDDTSSLANPWYVYPQNGDYKVTLKVTNSLCEDEYSFIVKVRSKGKFDLGPDLVYCEEFSKVLDTKTPNASSVVWNNGESGQHLLVKETGTYIAKVSFEHCVHYDTIRIDAFPIVLNLTDDSLFCDNVDIVLGAGISNHRYSWNTSVNDTFQTLRVTKAGIYVVAVSNKQCTKTDTVVIRRAITPAIRDTFFCNAFSYLVSVDSAEGVSYFWSNGSSAITSIYTVPGTHWVRVQQKHCVKTDSFNIRNSIVEINLGPDEHFCDSVYKELKTITTLSSYYWNTKDTTSQIEIFKAGTYWVEVTDKYRCSDSDTIKITMSRSPLIELGPDTSICVNSIVTLGPNYSDDIASYLWNNGSATRQILTESAGEYKLIITDKMGCIGEDSIYVSITPFAQANELFIANAFTPSNDGLNDYFPFSKQVLNSGYAIDIYNRWGEKVFDSRLSEKQNWDGKYKNELVPPGTFFYLLVYMGCDGINRSINGTVNVLY